jgi:hypothetical protein
MSHEQPEGEVRRRPARAKVNPGNRGDWHVGIWLASEAEAEEIALLINERLRKQEAGGRRAVKRRLYALSYADAEEIRELCQIHSQRRVALLFGVHEATISRTRRRISWRVDGQRFTNAKLKEADVADIRRLAGHLRIIDIAQMFKIHRSTALRIVSHRTWRDL